MGIKSTVTTIIEKIIQGGKPPTWEDKNEDDKRG
jgi:hypothetical protein